MQNPRRHKTQVNRLACMCRWIVVYRSCMHEVHALFLHHFTFYFAKLSITTLEIGIIGTRAQLNFFFDLADGFETSEID